MEKTIYNKELFTHILSFLDNRECNNIICSFKHMIYFDNIRCAQNILLYGQVQSGKTSKIIDFILYSKNINILVIQNSRLMLSQYTHSLSANNIKYVVINSLSTYDEYKGQKVLIILNNKFRRTHLNYYIKNNNITNYSLILDESDQYLNKIKDESIFKKARDILHVTATPFKIKNICPIDMFVKIEPKHNYVGLNQVQFKQIDMYENKDDDKDTQILQEITNIINKDFINIQEGQGLMLINCFSKITKMCFIANHLSLKFIQIPFVVVATNTYLYYNGKRRILTIKNIQQIIDLFKNTNAILIAGRLSNRGINYTDSSYSRNITHQISIPNGDYTNYIQKCRILGIRNNNTNNIRPTIYNLILQKKHVNFMDKLFKLLDNCSESFEINTSFPSR